MESSFTPLFIYFIYLFYLFILFIYFIYLFYLFILFIYLFFFLFIYFVGWANVTGVMIDSIYLKMRERNLCNHRDYQVFIIALFCCYFSYF